MALTDAYYFSAFLVLIFFSIFQLALSARPFGITEGGDLISQTCNKTFHFDLCVSSLESDPNSLKTDVKGLAEISINLSIIQATEAISQLRTLIMNNSNDAYTDGCLKDCLDDYIDAVGNLRECNKAFSEGSYGTVNTLVTAAMSDSGACEDGFQEKPGYVSPLIGRSDFFNKLCSNSLSITNLLS
ncbi:putative invertase inhibitor [Tasmannia lanceolata]|uniref:putative invertase inhibitor n=1 Tax=Tasmannia lanceolata TaxID=3420 RepID=UPI004064327A